MKTNATHTPGPWKEAAGAILTADTTPDNPRPPVALLSTAWPSGQYVGNGWLIAAAPELLEELTASHAIIINALQVMTTEQKAEWGRLNAEAGVDGDGITRYHERAAAITRATQWNGV